MTDRKLTLVHNLKKNVAPVDYNYREHKIHIEYRPRFNDFVYTITRNIPVKHSGPAPSLEAARRQAEAWVDSIKRTRVKR